MRIQLESIRREEVLRYLGWRGSAIPDEVSAQLDRCMEETLRVVQPRYVNWSAQTAGFGCIARTFLCPVWMRCSGIANAVF